MEISELHIDPLFHARARFLIMLLMLQKRECPFLQLAESVGLSRGNLSIQVRRLQKAGSIEIVKAFKNNYSHTVCKITPKGISTFNAYCNVMERAIKMCRLNFLNNGIYLAVKINGKDAPLLVETIHYIESRGNYVRLFTGDTTVLTKFTTARLEKILPDSIFMRVHRSYIINKTRIDRINENTLLIGSTEIPIGKTYKRYVMESGKTANPLSPQEKE